MVRRNLPIYKCPKVQVPPIIDGALDDIAWSSVPSVNLLDCQNGSPTDRRTSVRLCWDDNYLYVAFECCDEEIHNSYSNHDDPIFLEDAVEVFLDPDCDEMSYFEIDVSPSNIVFDADIDPSNGKPIDSPIPRKWSCDGIRSATTIDIENTIWIVEMAIPFDSIGRKTPEFGEEWRINFYRVDQFPAPAEYLAWSPTLTNPVSFHVPEQFGILVFRDN